MRRSVREQDAPDLQMPDPLAVGGVLGGGRVRDPEVYEGSGCVLQFPFEEAELGVSG
ncbi:hypothetical protein SUDANB1_05078 [Streptomyces sp. enrichment culture]|uniref:hypothetical protein n=1 Tax=Streptomyces sp. enrichment culture TaxID=1795815 RepID=UPI003F553310